MAKTNHAIEYLGAVEVKAGLQYLSDQILQEFPTATVMKMKTDDIEVGIDGGVRFHVTYDDESYVTAGKSYIFDKDCVIAIGVYKVIV